MLKKYKNVELSERYKAIEPELQWIIRQRLEEVYEMMKERGLTISEVADRIKIDRTMLWRVFNGERSMRVNDVPVMSKLLNVTANEFFFDKKKAVNITPDAEVFIDAYVRLNEEQRKILDAEMLEKAAEITECLEADRAYIELSIHRRFKKFCDANMIAYEDLIDKSESTLVKSAAMRMFNMGKFVIKTEFFMYYCLILDISADYFITRDYTNSGVYRIGADGKKEFLTAEETGILKKFLLTEEDAQFLGKAMAMAVMN